MVAGCLLLHLSAEGAYVVRETSSKPEEDRIVQGLRGEILEQWESGYKAEDAIQTGKLEASFHNPKMRYPQVSSADKTQIFTVEQAS